MNQVGFVGWRGMVGSVLMQRMVEEKDFDLIEPVYFSTSSAGGKAPVYAGKESPNLKDASDIESLAKLDIILSCQGGDYTKEVFPKHRSNGLANPWHEALRIPLWYSRRLGKIE